MGGSTTVEGKNLAPLSCQASLTRHFPLRPPGFNIERFGFAVLIFFYSHRLNSPMLKPGGRGGWQDSCLTKFCVRGWCKVFTSHSLHFLHNRFQRNGKLKSQAGRQTLFCCCRCRKEGRRFPKALDDGRCGHTQVGSYVQALGGGWSNSKRNTRFAQKRVAM